MKSLFEAEGMKVIGPAATVADARRLVAENPLLAVVDINLKGETAYALIDRLHGEGIRIVVVTGYAVLPQLTEKVIAVLQKPFNAPELLATLRRALSN
jgi:DNA-binding NtrC family response regulator